MKLLRFGESMLLDLYLWLFAVLLVAAVVTAFVVPTTRPYAKKVWWAVFILIVPIIGIIVLRRRPGNRIDRSVSAGKEIAERKLSRFDSLVDYAHTASAEVDAELEGRKIELEVDRAIYETKLETIKQIDDSLERRKQLVKLMKEG